LKSDNNYVVRHSDPTQIIPMPFLTKMRFSFQFPREYHWHGESRSQAQSLHKHNRSVGYNFSYSVRCVSVWSIFTDFIIACLHCLSDCWLAVNVSLKCQPKVSSTNMQRLLPTTTGIGLTVFFAGIVSNIHDTRSRNRRHKSTPFWHRRQFLVRLSCSDAYLAPDLSAVADSGADYNTVNAVLFQARKWRALWLKWWLMIGRW